MEKYCKKCNSTKPIEEFSKGKKSKDGLQFYCKACVKENNKAFNERNPGYNSKWLKAHPNYISRFKELNPDYFYNKTKDWCRDNRERKNELTKLNAQKMMSDPLFKEMAYLKIKVNQVLRLRDRKEIFSGKIYRTIGLSKSDFVKYIERTWEPWMNFSNWGRSKGASQSSWCISYKISPSTAKTNRELHKLFHFSNIITVDSYLNKRKKLNQK